MKEALHEELAARLEAARARTLAFVSDLDDAALRAQPDPDFSPIGWHLGHVAFTEAEWILRRSGGDASMVAGRARMWAQSGCPKHERVAQPPRAELLRYMHEVRARVLELLPGLRFERGGPLLEQGFVGVFVEAHEHQHRETMAVVRQLELERSFATAAPPPAGDGLASVEPRAMTRVANIADDTVLVGTDARLAYDNERPAHPVRVHAFGIDETPASVRAWEEFRADGGYAREELWSAAGWAWRCAAGVRWPRGWTRDAAGALARVRLDGRLRPLHPDEAVVGIAAHEAEAFARWRGGRLPTESEWELAARRLERGADDTRDPRGPAPVRTPDLRSNVWQWTASPFAAYPGFRPFPYRGYSERYFDGEHRVLRGGSFATHPRIARATFRNWYQPHVRQIFAGVRCAWS